MTICQDWRAAGDAEIAGLLAAEVQAWRRDLDWDVAEAWKVVDPARRAGHLPGFVARRGGRTVGWTSFLLHRESLQVLAFAADDPEAAGALVNAIAGSREAGAARSTIFCVRDASPALSGMLLRRGFDVEPYRYLRLDLGTLQTTSHQVPVERGDASALPRGLRVWNEDADAMVGLCARAYADAAGVRAFAPGGTIEEWHDYVGSLLSGPGCGWFLPEASFVRPSPRGHGLDGAILTTDLGPGTAHVAQIVVDPDVRGRGLGRSLLVASARTAARLGYRRMTLLVSETNAPAAAMYGAIGFVDRAAFVVATRRQPILSMRPALATGGESTRR